MHRPHSQRRNIPDAFQQLSHLLTEEKAVDRVMTLPDGIVMSLCTMLRGKED